MCLKEKNCILINIRCDGKKYWFDQTDEDNCGNSRRYVCQLLYFFPDFPSCDPATEFMCLKDKNCIPINIRCDGKKDCFDQTDEDNCGNYSNNTTGPTIQL